MRCRFGPRGASMRTLDCRRIPTRPTQSRGASDDVGGYHRISAGPLSVELFHVDELHGAVPVEGLDMPAGLVETEASIQANGAFVERRDIQHHPARAVEEAGKL